MTNLLSFALFEARTFIEYQLAPSLKQRLDKDIILGSLKSYEILNQNQPKKAILKLVDYRDNILEIALTYTYIEKFKRDEHYKLIDVTNKSRLYYLLFDDGGDYSKFLKDAYSSYLKDKQVKKIKIGNIEIDKQDVINHVENEDIYKKMIQDFDLINITTSREAKNGTLSFYYKYQNEDAQDVEPYPMWKISGKSGIIYDTRGLAKTLVKYGPMQNKEDYLKALNFLYEYLGNIFMKRTKEFKKKMIDDPSLPKQFPGFYKMVQKIDNPTLFKNDKLKNLISTGLFD